MLQEKNIEIKVINILENWFGKNFTVIKWGGILSRRVPLLSGVKQGGILSPLLLSLFVDIVLKKLEKASIGCFIHNKCYNSFMYADDIILLSITVTDLQCIFNLCSTVFIKLDLPINVSKFHCLRVGPRFNAPCGLLTIHGVVIHWVESIKFLGITICKSNVFKCDWSEAKRKFYCSANVILGRLG